MALLCFIISMKNDANLSRAVWRDYPLPPACHPAGIRYIERFRGYRKLNGVTRHPHWEFIAVLEGNGRLEIPEEIPLLLEPDTVCLVPPGTGHIELAPGRMDLLWVGFHIELAEAQRPAGVAGVKSAGLCRELTRLWQLSVDHFDRTGLELEGRLLTALGAFLRLRREHAEHGRLLLSEAIRALSACPDRNLPVADLAARCRCSRSHFSREFRRLTGMPPGEYQLQQRLRRARVYLTETDVPAAQIAGLCGFRSPGYFNRVFREKVGCPPGRYRARTRILPESP